MSASSRPQDEKARLVHAILLRRVSEVKQGAIAEAMGVSAATISRTINEDLEKISAILAAMDLVPARDDALVVDAEEISALKTFAYKYVMSQWKPEGV